MQTTTAVIDGHVHLHPCYRADAFFDAAYRNLESAARARRVDDFAAYLLFTECRGDRAFAELKARASAVDAAPAALPAGWTASRTREDVALQLVNAGRRLFVVGGKQVQCREGLEVLLLGTEAEFEDGRSIEDVLQLAAAQEIPHVIPWGAGKWFFGRGRLLRDLLQRHRSPWFFLGDEGGRPVFWPYPKHFVEGASVGVRDLPGTDPLPFPWDAGKVGRMGSILTIALDAGRPWASLRAAIGRSDVVPARFARLESIPMFVRNQAGMQLRKRAAG
jgi:hypothetical protein